jgi:hypothetical protein
MSKDYFSKYDYEKIRDLSLRELVDLVMYDDIDTEVVKRVDSMIDYKAVDLSKIFFESEYEKSR